MIFEVTDGSRVSEIRRFAAELAGQNDLDAEAAGRVAIIATELTTNILKHAGTGQVAACIFDDAEGTGVEILALDAGPGLDPARAFDDGFSTAGSSGTGLGGARRLADVFDIATGSAGGTAIVARVRRKGAATEGATLGFRIGVIGAPYPGETVCGDSWSLRLTPTGAVLMMVDGLGHGLLAARAAAAAVEAFDAAPPGRAADAILQGLHVALAGTRGGVVAVADVDLAAGRVAYAGVGNIAGVLLAGQSVQRMVSLDGTAGHLAPRIKKFEYRFERPPTIVMHSDGLSARWEAARYPHFTTLHPSLVAAVLFRDQRRGRDDATIAVLRAGPA